jgi:hypothetical protein
MKIYVDLLDEGTDVRYPVEVVALSDDVYRLVGVNPDPEGLHWAFNTGATVRCKSATSSEGETILVAFEEVAH